MANIKITQLAATTDPASTDVLPIIDVSADTTNKVSVADLLESAGDGTVSAPGISFDSDSDTGIYRVAANELGISTGGTHRVVVDNAGNVGIGTSSPTEKLHLSDASAYSILLERTGGTPSEVSLANENNTAAISNNTNGIAFKTGTTPSEVMRIDANGDVGIGTDDPRAHLHISAGAPELRFQDNDATGSPYSSITAIDGNLAFRADYGASGTGGVHVFTSNNVERMRITSAGNVGIGATNPNRPLTIVNSTPVIRLQDADGTDQFTELQQAAGNSFWDNRNNTNAGAHIFRLYNGTAQEERMRIHNNGFVGIGTTAPGEKLEVNGTIKATDINFTGLSTFADDSAAGTGGLAAGDVYKTSTGELRIKL